MDIEELSKFGIEGFRERKLIIDIYTEWCGRCKYLSIVLEKLRDEGLINFRLRKLI